jgi:site-specific recombinase XerD
MRDLSAAHAEAFLEMMSAERGAAKNTLTSYEKDLDELSAFLRTRNTTLGAAGTADLQAFLGQMAREGYRPHRRRGGSPRYASSTNSSMRKTSAATTRPAFWTRPRRAGRCRRP